jgi:hypothetical protein
VKWDTLKNNVRHVEAITPMIKEENRMIRLSWGKENVDGTKAAYLRDTQEKKRIFCFWYDKQNDNPYDLKPHEAFTSLINKAGYKDWEDYYNTNKDNPSKQIK